VLDIPGGYGKVPIAAGAARPGERPGRWRIADASGREHAYPPPDDPAKP
jgi:lysine 2,3-aminomutase